MSAPVPRPNVPGPPQKRRGRLVWLLWLVGWLAATIVSGTVEQLTSNWLTGDWWVVIGVTGVLVIGAVKAAWDQWGDSAKRRQGPPAPAASPAVRLDGPPVLPPDVAGFIGRGKALDRVVAAAKRHRVVAVRGRRGVGTSAFVLHAGHLVAKRFSDGQVHVDVRGNENKPLTPGQVLARVRRMLGLPEPLSGRDEDLEAASHELRTWLAGRQVLVVLDNVDDPDQVRYVLPSAPGSVAFLAGSGPLHTIGAAHCVEIGELSEQEAQDLLASVAGSEFVTEEPAAANELVALCARQPLAIRLLGNIRGRPLRAVADAMRKAHEASQYAAPQPDGAGALHELWDGCDVAYQELTARQQRMFRMLALVPTTQISVPAAAALTGYRSARAAALLEALARQGFVEPAGSGRYRLRKLLAESSRFHLGRSESPRRLSRARVWLARYYASQAAHHGSAFALATREPAPEHDAELTRAKQWFGAEHDLLFHLVTSWHTTPDRDVATRVPLRLERLLWRIAVHLCAWYAAEQRVTERGEVCEAIRTTRLADIDHRVRSWAANELAVVRRCQADAGGARDALAALASQCHHSVRARVHTNLGLAYLDLHAPDTAILHLEQAVEQRPPRDRYGAAVGDLALGVAYLDTGDTASAMRKLTDAAETFASLGDTRALAAALNNLGLVHWAQGERAAAHERWQQATTGYTDLDDRLGLAKVHLNVAAALIATHTDQTREARELLHESLRLRAAYPTTVGTGLCHLHLGEAAAADQDMASARQHWEKALGIFTRLDAPEAAEADQRLAQLRPGQVAAPRRKVPEPRSPRNRSRSLRGWLRRFLDARSRGGYGPA